MFRAAASPELPRDTTYFLIASAALGLAPFIPYLPWSIAILAGVLLSLRALLAWQERPPPASMFLLLIAGVGALLTVREYHMLFGKQAGLSLLAILLPLKLLESRTRRDGRASLLLCCFLLTGQFLNAQSMLVACFVLLCTLAIVASSAKLEQPGLSLQSALRTAASLLGAALPLMLLLFVLFPRINGPLWGLPLDAYAGSTGLSDRMKPGSISSLIQSGEVAFRAKFNGTLPPPAERYWRGPVLSNFDGQEWRIRETGAQREANYPASGPAYTYTLTLEPHNQPWLLAMDHPVNADMDVLYGADLSLLSRRLVRSRIRYQLTSYPEARVGLNEHTNTLRATLDLPSGSNPRSVAFGSSLKERYKTPTERVAAAINFMRQARLAYTLNPPLLGQHSTDEFLFDSRQGFCEHFAGAFVILMRAAGVPARVVTGYQGGEFNPLDETLVVRQSDAHAWAEVWLAERGWLRVDPTAASAPRRIDDGIANALPEGDLLPMMLRPNLSFLRDLRHRWEALNNGWNQWVLGYNAQRQLDLMRKLGLNNADWRQLAGLLSAGACLWLAWLTLRLWPRQKRLDPLERAWHKACHKLAHKGLNRRPWETPQAFASRVSTADPEIAVTFNVLAEHYSLLRYGPPPTNPSQALAAFVSAVQQFKP